MRLKDAKRIVIAKSEDAQFVIWANITRDEGEDRSLCGIRTDDVTWEGREEVYHLRAVEGVSPPILEECFVVGALFAVRGFAFVGFSFARW